MNKSKIIGLVLGFGVMVFATPVVFDKLMNAKLSQIVKNIEKKGIQIEEIADKSGYLNTNRVFKVVIPGSLINNADIKRVVLEVSTQFKNLPVTKVDFKGKVLEIDFTDPQLRAEINRAIKDKIKFIVMTPDFKLYNYRILDNSILLEDMNISYQNIKGVYLYPKKNDLRAESLKFKVLTAPVSFELKNIHSVNRSESTKKESDFFANLYFKIQNVSGNILNISTHSVTLFNKEYTTASFSSSFSTFTIQNLGTVKGFKSNLLVNNLKTEYTKELIKNPSDKDALYKLLMAGFEGKGDLNIDKVEFKKQNVGYLAFNYNFKILPFTQNEDFSKHLIFNAHLKTTPTLIGVIGAAVPQIMLFTKITKDKEAVIDAQYDRGKIIVNGTPIN